MKRLRLAIIGFGRVGKACAEVIHESHDLALAGVVRRPESMGCPLPERFRNIPVVSQIAQIPDLHGALICVPTMEAVAADQACLQQGVPVVDCATLHGGSLHVHKEVVHRVALHHGVPAVVGAGWDPGALSLFRALFALMAPGGSTETRHRTGISLHHTTMVQKVAGVKDALCAERRTGEGKLQRYVYVELEKGANEDRVAQAIRADPLFLGEETFVFPVESVAALEQEGRGVVLERRGAPRQLGHQQFLLEARFDESVLTAQIMVAAARALPRLKPGAYSLLDVPVSAMWGSGSEKAEREWL